MNGGSLSAINLTFTQLITTQNQIEYPLVKQDSEFWRLQGHFIFAKMLNFINYTIKKPLTSPRNYSDVLQGQVNGNREDQLKQISDFRNNLSNYGKGYKNENGLQILSVQDYYKQRDDYLNKSSLNDISFLRSEYIKRGGQNPEFLQNIQNMEKYFEGKKQYQNLINNPNALQIQRNATPQKPSYSHPAISQSNIFNTFQNELQTFSMLNNQNQLTIPPQLRSNNSSLTQINDSMFAGKKSDQEQMYDYFSQQESELLLDMSRIHPNSYMFQNKKEQYQKVRALKNEIEKSMIFNRVNKSMNNNMQPSFSQSMVMPPNIPTKLVDYSQKADYFPQRNGAYFAQEGFIIRFDYAALLPPNFDQVFINFGIFKKGQSLDPYLKTAIYNAEMDSILSQKCIFTEKRNIHEVNPHQDTIIYFEMYANEKDPLKRNMTKRAWTMHEIFDSQTVLNCGRFKLPFYNKNLNPQLLIQSGLPQMTDSSLFVRICFPNDPYLDNNTYIFIENEYKVPYFHLRNPIQIASQNQMPSQTFQPQVQIIRGDYYRDKQAQDEAEQSRLNLLQQEFDQSYVPNQPINQPKQQPIPVQQEVQQPVQQQSQKPVINNRPKLSVNTKQNKKENVQPNLITQTDSSQSIQKPSIQLQPVQNTPQQKPPADQSQQSFYNQPYIQQQQNLPSSYRPSDGSSNQNILNTSQNQNDNNLTDGVVIKVVKLEGFKIDQLKGQLSIKIFEGNNIMLDQNGKECSDLFDITYVSGFNQLEIERVFQISIKNMLKSYKKIQLDKIFAFISIMAGNQTLAWLIAPLFKTSFKESNLNNGKFKENLNKPPVKKPPFLKSYPKLDMELEYIIHDPDILEDEVNEIDTVNSNTQQQRRQTQQSDSSPRLKNNTMIDGLIIPEVKKVDKVDGPRNVLLIEIDTLTKYKNNLSISYDLVILKPQEIVNDEFGNPSVYHFDELIPPTENTDNVEFKTSIKVPLDLELAMKKKLPNWEQYHIIFKFVEVDDDDKEVTLGWLAHPLYKNKKLNQGVFNEFIYDPPLQINVPLNKGIIKKRQEKLGYKIAINQLPAEEYNLLQQNDHLDQTLGVSEKKSETVQRNVFTVVVHSLRNIDKAGDLQVNIALLFNDDFMNDDFNQQCTFQGDVKQCIKNVIQFLEEYNFEIDIKKMAQKYKDQLNKINLVIYLLDKNREPKYWFFCKLFDNKGNPHIGTFESKVFNIPIQRMTQIDIKKLKESPAVLKYSFLEGVQDDEIESQYSPD